MSPPVSEGPISTGITGTRLKSGAPLNEPDRATFYGGIERGYTDYPTLAQADGVAATPRAIT